MRHRDVKTGRCSRIPGNVIPGNVIPGNVIPGNVIPGSVIPRNVAAALIARHRRTLPPI